MLKVMIAGRTGRNAEHKTTQGGTDLCSFSVAADVGYGDNKQTVWVDVTKWGKGAEGLARILKKGSSVSVIGDLSTREHNGKTYLQCRADEVSIHGIPLGDDRGERKQSYDAPAADDLDDDIPFDCR